MRTHPHLLMTNADFTWAGLACSNHANRLCAYSSKRSTGPPVSCTGAFKQIAMQPATMLCTHQSAMQVAGLTATIQGKSHEQGQLLNKIGAAWRISWACL